MPVIEDHADQAPRHKWLRGRSGLIWIATSACLPSRCAMLGHVSFLSKVGYVGAIDDDRLDKIIRFQALIAVGSLIGRTRLGITWRMLVSPVWFCAGLVALADGRHLVGLCALVASAWFLPMAVANARIVRHQY
jgi:hypothetical protein